MSALLNGTFGQGVLVLSSSQNFKNRPSSFHLNLKKSSPSSLVSGTNRDKDRPRNICPVPRTPATDTDSELDSIKSTASNNLKIDQNFWSKKTKIRTHGHEALREIQWTDSSTLLDLKFYSAVFHSNREWIFKVQRRSGHQTRVSIASEMTLAVKFWERKISSSWWES